MITHKLKEIKESADFCTIIRLGKYIGTVDVSTVTENDLASMMVGRKVAFKVDKPDGTSFYAVTLEIPDALYLVKIKVKVDDYDDAEEVFKNEDGDEDEEGEGGSFPASDDDIAAAEAAQEEGED